MPTSAPAPVNHWPDSKCARAFWGQQETPAYRRLLAHTVAWLEPRAGDRWLDLGCGCGKLTEALWAKSLGCVGQIVGLDCAAANERAFQQLRARLRPPASERTIRFRCADFSTGLAEWDDNSFDGVVSGLAVHYAESYSKALGGWTTEAYDHLLAEVYRVLRPGRPFVFSVNRPEPAWSVLALCSVGGVFQTSRPLRYLKRSLRMLRYGVWIKKEARRGRFQYLPVDVVVDKLAEAGFEAVEHRRSFAAQALVFRARKAG
jgi:ubiquinone/menaquinone biosynthesis C-methylase UbiE